MTFKFSPKREWKSIPTMSKQIMLALSILADKKWPGIYNSWRLVSISTLKNDPRVDQFSIRVNVLRYPRDIYVWTLMLTLPPIENALVDFFLTDVIYFSHCRNVYPYPVIQVNYTSPPSWIKSCHSVLTLRLTLSVSKLLFDLLRFVVEVQHLSLRFFLCL